MLLRLELFLHLLVLRLNLIDLRTLLIESTSLGRMTLELLMRLRSNWAFYHLVHLRHLTYVVLLRISHLWNHLLHLGFISIHRHWGLRSKSLISKVICFLLLYLRLFLGLGLPIRSLLMYTHLLGHHLLLIWVDLIARKAHLLIILHWRHSLVLLLRDLLRSSLHHHLTLRYSLVHHLSRHHLLVTLLIHRHSSHHLGLVRLFQILIHCLILLRPWFFPLLYPCIW